MIIFEDSHAMKMFMLSPILTEDHHYRDDGLEWSKAQEDCHSRDQQKPIGPTVPDRKKYC
jgi:hypothetical protein